MTRHDLQKFLSNCNVIAFLKAIRLGEGTSDEMGNFQIIAGRNDAH